VSSPAEPPRAPGLRERKKARTRAAIQEHALRLFGDQGYAATTVEQIAEAADVSPSTFFRYFATKEDVVLHDRYDPILIEAYRRQPTDVGPVRALRNVLREVFGSLSDDELAVERERQRLTLATPELRARALDQIGEGFGLLSELVAERSGRPAGDPAVRALAGAVLGIAVAAMLGSPERPQAELADLLDEGLAQLERGLPV
jgi:AcrR family transcriptional regulator